MSEFERAVFRVYENTIDGLNFDGIQTNFSTKLIKFSELFFRYVAILSFFIVIFLHGRFVGDHKLNCLPAQLSLHDGMSPFTSSSLAGAPTSFGNNSNHTNFTDIHSVATNVFFNFTDDYILHINVYNLEDELTNIKLVKLNSSTDTGDNEDKQFQLQRKKPDFTYAPTSAVLSLKSELQKNKFEVVNITLPHQECFGEFPWIGGSIYGLVAYFDGVGTVLMNNLIYTSKRSGVLMKYSGSRAWWDEDDLHLDDDLTSHDKEATGDMMAPLIAMNDMMWHKIGILFYACLAFFLLSTSTAMLIRILLSSGVIILYPILMLLESVFARGFSMRTAYRLMTLAYPWLGLPMEILRVRRMSAIPFLIGHATQIVVYYVLYEGLQILIAMWIYNHSLPDLLDVWLYSLMMLAEYYSIVYVRSVASIRFFPRFFCGFFVVYHIYVFSFPSGFHYAALVSFTTATVSLLLFSLRKLEYPAFMRGDVVIDRPRGLYNSLPYAYNGIFLPPEFTIFMPLNRRARNVYDVSEPSEGESGDEEEEDVQDLEMGPINRTETPLLFQHHQQGGQGQGQGQGQGNGQWQSPTATAASAATGRGSSSTTTTSGSGSRTGRGGSRANSSSNSSGGGSGGGSGSGNVASYYSMSPPPLPSSGRRRRRRRRYDRQPSPSTSPSTSASPSSSSSRNSPTSTTRQGETLNDEHDRTLRRSREEKKGNDSNDQESDTSENEHYLEFESKDDDYGDNRANISTPNTLSLPADTTPRRDYSGGDTVVGRGLRRLAYAAGATTNPSGGSYQALTDTDRDLSRKDTDSM